MRTSWLLLSALVLLSSLPPPEVFAGQILMQGVPGRTSPVITDLTNQIQIDPSALNFKNRAAEYKKLGLPAEAVNDLDKAIELEPKDVIARTLKAEVYFNSGMYPEAAKECEAALSLDPNFVGAQVLRTRAHIRMKDFNKALEEANALLALTPKSPEPLLLRGAAYEGLGKTQEAVADLTAAVTADPKMTKAYYYRAKAYADAGQYDKSVDDFSKAIELEPTFRPALLGRAWSKFKLGKSDQAIEDASDAIQFDVDMLKAQNKFIGEKQNVADITPDPEYNWGLHIEEDLKNAVLLYDAVLKEKPGDAETSRDRGIAYMHLGKYREAKRDFDVANRGLPVNPSDFSGLGSEDAYNAAKVEYKLGNEEMTNGNYDKSLEHYQNALQKYPQYARAWHNMAIDYGVYNDFFSAELCCIHALSYRPDDWKIWNTFGYTLFHEYQRDKSDPAKLSAAQSALETALALGPDNADDKTQVKDTLGRVKAYERSLAPTSNFIITTMPLI